MRKKKKLISLPCAFRHYTYALLSDDGGALYLLTAVRLPFIIPPPPRPDDDAAGILYTPYLGLKH